jgi:predicted porin
MVAALVAPLAAQAEVKLSGTIQGELGSLEIGGADSVTNSNDGTGALFGGGPNKIMFDMSEDLGAGLSAIGRLDFSFNTSNGSGVAKRESFVGLKSSSGAYFRTGRIQGAYKTATKIDPFYSTAGQMRIGGGESSGAFSHGSFVDNVFEVGFSGGGFKAALQGIFDEGNNMDGSMLADVEYSTDMFTVFGAYSKDESKLKDSDTNWKVGGKMNFGGLGVGLQYEDAENNHATLAPSASGEYITGSLTYGMGNVILAGWVSQYTDSTNAANADAMSFAVGGIYTFSKKTLVYGAYHSIDVDGGDAGDLAGFAVGIRHSF